MELFPTDNAADKFYLVAARWNYTLNITNSTYDHMGVINWDTGTKKPPS